MEELFFQVLVVGGFRFEVLEECFFLGVGVGEGTGVDCQEVVLQEFFAGKAGEGGVFEGSAHFESWKIDEFFFGEGSCQFFGGEGMEGGVGTGTDAIFAAEKSPGESLMKVGGGKRSEFGGVGRKAEICIDGSVGVDGTGGAIVEAEGAVATLVRDNLILGLNFEVGEDFPQKHVGSVVGNDEIATFAYPAQTRQMGQISFGQGSRVNCYFGLCRKIRGDKFGNFGEFVAKNQVVISASGVSGNKGRLLNPRENFVRIGQNHDRFNLGENIGERLF